MVDQSCGMIDCVNQCGGDDTWRTCPAAQKARKARYNAKRQRSFRKRREVYIDQLEFFCAILLAVSVNRAANLEALEDFIHNLKKATNGPTS